jgi:hypothetical protein
MLKLQKETAMPLVDDLKSLMETEERNTVGDSFGGPRGNGASSYSVTKIRDWLINQALNDGTEAETILLNIKGCLPAKLFKVVLGNLIRFSFLIELTNLKVGSTKMKTRWLPGLILMPQPGSFEPMQGSFEPGNDPRSSTYEDCLRVFLFCLKDLCVRYREDTSLADRLLKITEYSSIPYEFTYEYRDSTSTPLHHESNIQWVFNDDIAWLSEARPIIWASITKQQINKIQTKTYKTDRALTGKDKTNRAKRWEVRADDFQHATLQQCWSVERRLLESLCGFEEFPAQTITSLQDKNLLDPNIVSLSRCPVTLEPLKFNTLMLDAVHGRSDYQVGHLHPLKRGGNHQGDNISWQSSDGNRIQGDMTIEEITALLRDISTRYVAISS